MGRGEGIDIKFGYPIAFIALSSLACTSVMKITCRHEFDQGYDVGGSRGLEQ